MAMAGAKKRSSTFLASHPSTTDFRHLKSNIQVSVVGYGGGQKKIKHFFGIWAPST
jgi:hypothetical protein